MGVLPRRWKQFERFLEDLGPPPKGEVWVTKRNHGRPHGPRNSYWTVYTHVKDLPRALQRRLEQPRVPQRRNTRGPSRLPHPLPRTGRAPQNICGTSMSDSKVTRMSTVKGHWPKGRRRNPTDGVTALVAHTRRLLRKPIPGKVSRKALAKYIDVDPRTVSRWLQGIDVPSLASKRKWSKWISLLGV